MGIQVDGHTNMFRNHNFIKYAPCLALCLAPFPFPDSSLSPFPVPASALCLVSCSPPCLVPIHNPIPRPFPALCPAPIPDPTTSLGPSPTVLFEKKTIPNRFLYPMRGKMYNFFYFVFISIYFNYLSFDSKNLPCNGGLLLKLIVISEKSIRAEFGPIQNLNDGSQRGALRVKSFLLPNSVKFKLDPFITDVLKNELGVNLTEA